LAAYGLQEGGFSWQSKVASMVIPAVIYGAMFFGMKFPPTVGVGSGVSTGDIVSSVLHLVVAYIFPFVAIILWSQGTLVLRILAAVVSIVWLVIMTRMDGQRYLFLFMAFCMLLTASTELSTNQWIAELLSNVGVPGILILVWINGL